MTAIVVAACTGSPPSQPPPHSITATVSVPTGAPPTAPASATDPPSLLVKHGARDSQRVALTFDMGGRVGDARAIVDWLVDNDLHASIFMTGAMADNPNTNAGRRVLREVDAHPDLFTLGNHSYTHRDFRKLTRAEIKDELRRTKVAIAPYCPQSLRPFFRPPNGGTNDRVLAAVGAARYRYTVTWDIDTIDWRPVDNDPPGPTADQIVTRVLSGARGGSIILMHLGGYETFEALPRVVSGLHDAGFHLVTLDELLLR